MTTLRRLIIAAVLATAALGLLPALASAAPPGDLAPARPFEAPATTD
jgi:hypothetical protein